MPRDIRDLLQTGAARPSRPAPTGPVWRQGRRRRITKLTVAAAAVLVVLASSVAAATLLDGADAPEILGQPDPPMAGPTGTPSPGIDHGPPLVDPVGPGGMLHCSGVLDMDSRQAAELLHGLGFELEWRFQISGPTVMTPDPQRNQPGAVEGYSAVRETRPEGDVREVIVYGDGTVLVFVTPPDDPITELELYPDDYLCSDATPTVPSPGDPAPIPTTARPLQWDDLPTDGLRALVAPAHDLFELPTGQETSVYVADRDREPPLMFATACAVLADIDIPDGWQGICLERTDDGRRQTGRFPHPNNR